MRESDVGLQHQPLRSPPPDLGGRQYCLTNGVLVRSLGTSMVLFHPETERLLTLNTCGKRIWQLLSEEADSMQIIARLTEEFEGSVALIKEQVLEFLSELESERLIHRKE